jgi:hypothetical protein
MAIIKGSLSYSPCGRKRKRLKKSRKTYTVGKPLRSSSSDRLERIRAQEKAYPSFEDQKRKTFKPEDTSYKKEVSKKYTISIAYNKGAYQVIPQSNIKDIGK